MTTLGTAVGVRQLMNEEAHRTFESGARRVGPAIDEDEDDLSALDHDDLITPLDKLFYR